MPRSTGAEDLNASPFDLFDNWWGEYFGPSLFEHIELPLDQMMSLYESIKDEQLPELQGPESAFSLEPAMSPWGIENHELLRSLATSRMVADMLNGLNRPGEAYAFVPYDGFYAFDPQSDRQRPVGPHWVITERNRLADFEKTLRSIASLTLLCPTVHLCIDDLLPRTPPEGSKDGAWQAWHDDALFRLRAMALLRPLAQVGGIALVRAATPEDEVLSSDVVNDDVLIRPGEADELLEGYKLHVGRIGEPRFEGGRILSLPKESLGGYDDFYRDQTAEGLILREVRNALSWSSQSRAQFTTQYEAARRVLDSTLKGMIPRSAPQKPLVERFVTVGMGETSHLASLLFSAYNLRRTGEFPAWRETLANALQAIGDLEADDDPADARRFILETMKPGVDNLRRLSGQPMTLKEAGESAAKGITIGAIGFGIGLAAGAPTLPAAGTALAAALGRPLLDLIASRRKRHSPTYDAYVALRGI